MKLIRPTTGFHERTSTRVGDTTVALDEDGELLGFVMVVGDGARSRTRLGPQGWRRWRQSA